MEGELERAEERAETGETKVTHVKLFVAKLNKSFWMFCCKFKQKQAHFLFYLPQGLHSNILKLCCTISCVGDNIVNVLVAINLFVLLNY